MPYFTICPCAENIVQQKLSEMTSTANNGIFLSKFPQAAGCFYAYLLLSAANKKLLGFLAN